MAIKVERESIWLDFPGTAREEIIQNICFKLKDIGKTDDPSGLYQDIMEREGLVSTFAGHDTAIPHVVTNHINGPALCFIRVADPDLTWHGNSETVTFVVFSAVPKGEAAATIRAEQSQIFGALALLIRTPDVTSVWKVAKDAEVIQKSLNFTLT